MMSPCKAAFLKGFSRNHLADMYIHKCTYILVYSYSRGDAQYKKCWYSLLSCLWESLEYHESVSVSGGGGGGLGLKAMTFIAVH
jgi:hypothetical protein